MVRKKGIKVRKSGGRLEHFDVGKLRSSLLRSGADPAMLDDLVDDVIEGLGRETTTREIYRFAHARLRKMDRACGMRYTLKQSLFRLGPTGYPFERYVADIFKEYGYRTEVGTTLRGRCVSHEIDVLAVSDDEVIVMECKYHNSKGTTTDVKTALYVQSRVLDLEPTVRSAHPGRNYSGRIVTNTRGTADAVDYCRCAGLDILSWRYPEGRSLEKMIEERKLYPVTIVAGIQAGLVKKLISKEILLLRDLLTMDAGTIQSLLGLSPQRARRLREKAEALCG